MGGSKTKQQQQQSTTTANTYGWQQTPEWTGLAEMRDFEFQADPRISYNFARAANRMRDTYANPLGAYTTANLRDATLRAGIEDLAQEEGQATREENYARQALEYAKRSDVANLSQPRFVQTGGTSNSSGTSTTQQSQNPVNSIIGGASAMGSAMLM